MKLERITDIVYALREVNGDEHTEIIFFYLFPGIILSINYVNMHYINCTSDEFTSTSYTDYLRVNYCFEGRCEVKLKDGKYVYVDNNVLCVEDHSPQENFYYPLGFYRGIEISIDKKALTKTDSDLFDLLGISPSKLIEQYGNKNETFIKIASDLFAKKSAAIISIWEDKSLQTDSKIYQLRFALCQLFYYLLHDQAVNKDKEYNASSLSYGQYMIALDCEKRITKDLSQKQTIASIASDYQISPSSLKKFFSQVYGCSISEYLQTMRVKEAMQLLTKTDLSIMQISAMVGYENQSKFSAVFKKHTGYAPLEYKKIQILKRKEVEHETL